MITCKNLSKHFKSGETLTKALDGVDLEISKGEFLMIMGPSGCGKTLASYVIAGELKKTMVVVKCWLHMRCLVIYFYSFYIMLH